jgi:hypothetical protein
MKVLCPGSMVLTILSGATAKLALAASPTLALSVLVPSWGDDTVLDFTPTRQAFLSALMESGAADPNRDLGTATFSSSEESSDETRPGARTSVNEWDDVYRAAQRADDGCGTKICLPDEDNLVNKVALRPIFAAAPPLLLETSAAITGSWIGKTGEVNPSNWSDRCSHTAMSIC